MPERAYPNLSPYYALKVTDPVATRGSPWWVVLHDKGDVSYAETLDRATWLDTLEDAHGAVDFLLARGWVCCGSISIFQIFPHTGEPPVLLSTVPAQARQGSSKELL